MHMFFKLYKVQANLIIFLVFNPLYLFFWVKTAKIHVENLSHEF
jgi:hypothetical protein